MAGVVKVLLALAVLGAAVSLAADPKTDVASDRLLWTAYLFSREGGRADVTRRRPFNPLLDLDPVGLVHNWGYPGERHWVTTDDGYVLGLHRIPGPRGYRQGGQGRQGRQGDVRDPDGGNRVDSEDKAGGASRRPVVILAHPLLSSSAEWLVKGPGQSLALLLADEGYDVWLFNARGNTYSLNHTSLDVHDSRFWDFSFHEHGVLDLPATIQYVVRETGQQKLQYVGFSMGSTIMLVMASSRPDVAKHVSLFTAMGPATSLGRSRSTTFRALTAISPTLMMGARLLGVRQFLPASATIKAAGEIFCSDGSITQSLCTSLIAALSGRNDAQMNKTLLPRIIAKTPSGTSFKNINHFSQLVKAAAFQPYDYGKAENRLRYGRESPPTYNVSNVFIPTRVFYGLNDHLSDYKDVEAMCPRLPMLLGCEAVADPLWTHLDFVWGKDAHTLVYKKVMADMRKYAEAA